MKLTIGLLIAVLCAGVSLAETQPLPDYVPQGCEYGRRAEGDLVYYTRPNYTAEQIAELESKVIGQIASIRPGVTDRHQILELFGPPPEVMARRERPGESEFLTYRYGSVEFFFDPWKKLVHEIRFEKAGPYSYQGKIRVGSSLDELLAAVGAPAKTVVGEPIHFNEDRVLFRDVERTKGRGYITYDAEGVRFFLLNDAVTAIYLFKPKPPANTSP